MSTSVSVESSEAKARDGDVIQPVEFTTAGVEAPRRFEFWREQFCAVHNVEVDPEDRHDFAARGRNWSVGPFLVGAFETPARRVVRHPQHMRRDGLDHVVLRVLRRGEIRSRSDRGTFVLGPGEIAIGSYAATYTEEQTAGEWVTAIFPPGAVPSWLGQTPDAQVLRGMPAALLADFLLSLASRLDGLTPAMTGQLEVIMRAMVANCLVAYAGEGPVSPSDREILLRERVERVITAHLASPRLTPARIAELAGVSRSTLYRAYSPVGGIAGRLLRRRLELVRNDLENRSLANLSVAHLAERRGLHNAASFHRAFREHFGETPGDVRRAAMSWSAGRSDVPEIDGRLRFIDLLRPREQSRNGGLT